MKSMESEVEQTLVKFARGWQWTVVELRRVCFSSACSGIMNSGVEGELQRPRARPPTVFSTTADDAHYLRSYVMPKPEVEKLHP